MKKLLTLVVLVAVLSLVCTAAYAGPLSAVKEWLGGTAVALILTGLLAIGVIGVYAGWVSGILIATGYLFLSVGNAVSDKKITKEELADFKAKWNELRAAAKNRPKS
jgi:hypothetical protein